MRGRIKNLELVLVFFMMWGFMPSSLWAAQSDVENVINVLKSKKIVTQQEADELLQEAKANEEKQRDELKKYLADTSKDGGLAADSLKGFNLETTIFAEWNAKDVEDSSSANEFAVNRAYLKLTKQVNDWLSASVTTDIFTSKDTEDDEGNGWEIRLKYAYADLNLAGTQTLMGLIPTPSDAYDSSIWPYRVQGKNLLDGASIQTSSDFGISNAGSFGGTIQDKDFLKYAGKKFAGKWGGYMAGIYNGSGYSYSEENDNKVASGLVYIRPFANTQALKGLKLAYVGTYGKSNKNFSEGDVTDYPDWEVNIVQASYQQKYFTLMGQYYTGKGGYKATDEKDREAYTAAAFVRIPQVEKLRFFGKYCSFDPDTDTDDDDYTTYVGGLSYDFSSKFMPFVAFESCKYETETEKLKDYKKTQIGFQLKI